MTADALAPEGPVPWVGFERFHADVPEWVQWACLYPEAKAQAKTYSWRCHRCFIAMEASALANPTQVASTALDGFVVDGRQTTLGELYLQARGWRLTRRSNTTYESPTGYCGDERVAAAIKAVLTL